MECVAGHPFVAGTDIVPAIDVIRGAWLHELLHCWGVQHPTEVADGPQAWLDPMAGWWNFGRRGGTFVQRTKDTLLASPFVTG